MALNDFKARARAIAKVDVPKPRNHYIRVIHLPDLIQDLALILMVAGAVTLIFRRLKQPVVLGYIIAGILVGPYFPMVPDVMDTEGVKVWSEIGVIFLLFGLGLEFSFRKLARVGAPASITALFEVIGMVVIGFLTGKAFGWNSVDSMFLGGILAISSTTIIIRAFDELGMKTRGFVSLVFGVLIVEDLIAILLMVLLSTIAVSQVFSGSEMVLSASKLVFFMALWFVSGIFLLPTFLRFTRKFLSDETMLVVSIGLCFLMVVLATRAGFSPALGAFIMGSLLAETTEGERIEHLVASVRDLFAAIFFVSVGILIDPQVMIDHAAPILVITAVTIVGKTLSTAAGALISGQSLRHSVQAGMSLAQIGEFSFIIAGLGLTLKVTSDFLYPLAIGVSALTTFTTPYMIRSADKTVGWLQRALPKAWREKLEGTQRRRQTKIDRPLSGHLREFVMSAAPNAIVIIGITLATKYYFYPWLQTQTDTLLAAAVGSLLATVAICAPFLWAIAFRQGAEQPVPHRSVYFLRGSITVVAIGLIAAQFVAATAAILIAISMALVVGFILSRELGHIYEMLEKNFLKNLKEKENAMRSQSLPPLAPWDAHLQELTVSAESELIGKTLAEAQIRERFGVTIALIERGSHVLAAPGRITPIYPGDQLHIIGNDEQIALFKTACEGPLRMPRDLTSVDYILKPLTITNESPYAHKTIHNCGIREATKGLVVGIEKDGRRQLNPDSNILIEPGDLIWVVGDRKLAASLTE